MNNKIVGEVTRVGKNEIHSFKVLDDEEVKDGRLHADVSFVITSDCTNIYFRAREIHRCIESPMMSIFSIISATTGENGVTFNSSNDILDYLKIEKNEDMIFYVEAERKAVEISKQKCLEYYGIFDKNYNEEEKNEGEVE